MATYQQGRPPPAHQQQQYGHPPPGHYPQHQPPPPHATYGQPTAVAVMPPQVHPPQFYNDTMFTPFTEDELKETKRHQSAAIVLIVSCVLTAIFTLYYVVGIVAGIVLICAAHAAWQRCSSKCALLVGRDCCCCCCNTAKSQLGGVNAAYITGMVGMVIHVVIHCIIINQLGPQHAGWLRAFAWLALLTGLVCCGATGFLIYSWTKITKIYQEHEAEIPNLDVAIAGPGIVQAQAVEAAPPPPPPQQHPASGYPPQPGHPAAYPPQHGHAAYPPQPPPAGAPPQKQVYEGRHDV